MFLLVFVQCYVVFLQLAISKVYPFHFLIIVFLSDSANWKNCIFVVTQKEIRYLMIKCPKINNIFYNSKFLRRNLKNCWIVELLNRWIVELSPVCRKTLEQRTKSKDKRVEVLMCQQVYSHQSPVSGQDSWSVELLKNVPVNY